MTFIERFLEFRESRNTALICGKDSFTYQELYERARELAGKLRQSGVGLLSSAPDNYDIFNPGAAKHSPWVVIISKRSVNTLVGVIAAWMAGGAFVLLDAEAPGAYQDAVIQAAAPSAVLRGDAFSAKRAHELIDIHIPQANEIACAVFTSGSTKQPRGAVLEHRTIDEMLSWQTSYMKPGGGDATAAYAPFGFIAALWELFFPLANGLTLHILDETIRHDLIALERYIEDNAISYMFLPPNIAELFTKSYKGGALKYLRVAGGRLKSCAQPRGYEIMYHLGMAENGGSVTFNPIREAKSGDIPIGKPWNRTIIDLDGETGEMLVSGPSLFRGYLSRPDETARRLIGGKYRSGDIVRYSPNGELIHLGRSDWAVKIRDMLVNPEQVEAALLCCCDVADCCVTSEGGALTAWVVGGLEASALREQLAARLPEYMIPSEFIFIDSLPRGQNGKIDRKALIKAEINRGAEEPLTGGQGAAAALAALFARVLGRPAREDDAFFDLGGDSLKLMRLQLEIVREMYINVSYTTLLNNLTPRSLAAALETSEHIPPAPKLDAYPLIAPMRQMWLLWRTGQDGGKYTVSIQCRCEGAIDKARAVACFEELAHINSILRSRFIERGGDVFQVVEPSVEISLIDAPRSAFDLRHAPLFDISINENILSCTTHHIIADAIGLRVLMEDFWTLYGGNRPPASAQVIDIAVWEAGKTPNEAYWQELFSSGVPECSLPYDFERPARLAGFKQETILFGLDAAQRLRSYAAAHQTTLFGLFLAAFALMLSAVSKTDAMIGVPLNGRDHPDTARTIGNLARTLPLRLAVSGISFADALRQTRARLLELYEHQDMPLERLVEIVPCPRTAGQSPFYSVMANYIPLPQPLSNDSGLRPEILRKERQDALFDLVMDVREELSGVAVVFNYAPQLFKKETIRSWMKMLEASLPLPEQALAEAWSAVLKTDEPDFFAAGGTSLNAIRLEAALFERGWLLSAADILQNPDRGALAAFMAAADETNWEDGE